MKTCGYGKLLGVLAVLSLPGVAMAQSYEFTTCGATGSEGPAQGDCDTAYTGSTLDGDVTVSGGIQSWTVPTTGDYRITAVGAAGKSATNGARDGGRGARISGTFSLNSGDILQIVVGQEGLASDENGGGGPFVVAESNDDTGAEGPAGSSGAERNGGGGGGSFVVDNSDNAMLVAGGGGGTRHDAAGDGCHANIGEYATASSGTNFFAVCNVKSDDLGLGGIALDFLDYGSAGAGFNGDGEADHYGQGGRSWSNGMLGGHAGFWNIPGDGGFGGGGSGEGYNGGGGGGGYSGGDAGWVAGGGGSFNSGTNQAPAPAVGTGAGQVTIQLIGEGAGDGSGRATFEVTKEFTDGKNPTEVDVTINCFTGLPLEQTQSISESQGVTFVVTDFDEGELDCQITEEDINGYTPTYYPDSLGTFDSDGGCNFEDVVSGAVNTCHIVNDADPVAIEIEKLWVIEGPGDIDTSYRLTLYCNATIQDASDCGGGGPVLLADGPEGLSGAGTCKKFYGDGSAVFTAYVEPAYPESYCYVDELVYDSAVEIDNDCNDLLISAGAGVSCTITNTVFFEGIPTLNQYGLALLAMLMLGVGVVGFRRFA